MTRQPARIAPVVAGTGVATAALIEVTTKAPPTGSTRTTEASPNPTPPMTAATTAPAGLAGSTMRPTHQAVVLHL